LRKSRTLSIPFPPQPLNPTGVFPDNQGYWSDNDFTVRCCLPRDDGAWTVYACDGGRGNTPWQIYRFRTEDGIHLLDTEKVYQSEEGRWSQTTTLTYSPEKEKCLLRPSQDSLVIDLEWDSKDGRGLAGQKVRLRFYMRASQLYAVTA
jgi:hypothetical protein